MGKAKPGQNKDLNSTKQQLHTIKNGSVKKDKNPKFKNTPVGKVALINNSKAQNKNTSPQKNFQKDAGLKNNQNLSKNSAKQSKRNSAKNKQNSPNKAQNKSANMDIYLYPKKELKEMDDSDSDIDEEITLQEDVSLTKLGETSEDEEESDIDVPDILGKSLEDESDEDDEDFDDEEEEEEENEGDDDKGETVERINVKTFEGVKPKVKKNDDDKDNKNKIDRGQIHLMSMKDKAEHLLTMMDDDDDDDDDEDIDEDDDEDEENEFESDEDDEDFEEEEEEEDDDGDDNIEEETVEHKGVKMFKGIKTKVKNSDEDEDEDDEDEDEDEEDEENEEDEDSALGLKALLGNNITDEDDDEDFNEEDEDDEDDDISDEDEDGEENDNVVKVTKEKAAKASNSKDIPKEHKQVKKGVKLSPEEQEEIDKRTIFIDNVPIKETSKSDIKYQFGKFGPINNLRIRSIIPQDPKMSKKLAAIRKQIHPTAPTVVVYINYMSQESAQKALCMNGKIFRGNYIHVDIAHKSAKKRDNKKAVFIGNLKWGMDNNTIWKHFGKCGEIESVHLIRDKQTGQTKGFGYVNFKTEESAVLALKLDGDEILNRPIRVKPCLSVENKKGEKRVSSSDDGNPQKKLKNNLEKPVPRKAENEANIKKHKKLQKNNAKPEEQKSISFQGQKADSKNKKKENKFEKKKKEMAKKLTAKSNKPVKI